MARSTTKRTAPVAPAARRARSRAARCWRSCRSPAAPRCTPGSSRRSSSTSGCRPAARRSSPARPATSSLGRDLIPDDIPIIGGLDDLVVVVLAVELFLDGVPDDLLDEKLDELGIDRAAFDRDIAQIRRLTPGPVRRTIRRVPELVGGAGEAMKQLGLGPRMRAWINKEDRIA